MTPLKVPAAHGEHVAAEVAPTAVLRVPAGHAVQFACPGAAYVPAGQVWQTAEDVALTEADALPAGQAVHKERPVASA